LTTIDCIILGVIILLSGLYFKIKGHLSFISKSFSDDKAIRNKLEIVMQPKWYLYSFYIIILMWLYFIFIIAKYTGWWSILIIIGSYFSLAIILRVIILPTKRQLTKYFYSITLKRLSVTHRYTDEELIYLNASKSILQKLLKIY
jgi:hypothetical protein